jgi:hypothetical protein
MENLIVKTAKIRKNRVLKSGKTKKMISEEDIRRRAFEIYQEHAGSPHNEQDDWFRAERELKGYGR